MTDGVATTVSEAVASVAMALMEAGIDDSPRLDAELLIGHVAELDRVGIRVSGDRLLEPDQRQQLDALVDRRMTGEPIAYLLGSAWFYGREFLVDRRVLVPRPETELLVELTLEHFAEHATSSTFVDACTGSGCVAISISAELGGRARVVATDISTDALDVARINADRLQARVELRAGDLLEPVADLHRVAAIVANPPYVEGADAAGLEPGVRAHEPHVALLLPDGSSVVELYGRLADQALQLLEPGGLFAVEHGQGRREQVADALRRAGFVDVAGLDDLAGIDRVVVGYRAGGSS
jgi:release factor glutamine methyltransferase